MASTEYVVTGGTATSEIYATWVNTIDDTTASITDTNTYTSSIYPIWCDSSTVSITQTNDLRGYMTKVGPVFPRENRETEEERHVRIAREQREKRARDLRARLRRMAKRRAEKEIRKRARALLLSILTEEEQEDFRRHGSVRIRGRQGIYEIGSGWAGMAFKLDFEGVPQEKLCCHPSFDYPTDDRIAAVVLAIKADEERYLAKAVRHRFTEMERRRVAARRGHKHHGQRGLRIQEVA